MDAAADALMEAQRRAARGGTPRGVVILHLSRLPGTQQYHVHAARAIMADTARRLDGDVLRLANGDLALICPLARLHPDTALNDPEPWPRDLDLSGMPAVLSRLFAPVTPPGCRLISRLLLPHDGAELAALLEAISRAVPEEPAGPVFRRPADRLASCAAMLERADIGPLLRRQAALHLHQDEGGLSLMPVAQVVEVGPSAVEQLIGTYGVVQPDPLLVRHMATGLDARMLARLDADAALAWLPHPPVVLHLRLSLGAVCLPALEAVALRCRARQCDLYVELSLTEALAAPDLFDRARMRLRDLGCGLILGRIRADALASMRLERLAGGARPDLYRLEWDICLATLTGEAQAVLDARIAAIGVERMILTRADTEAALAWGLARRISVFEGRQVDVLLAEGRLHNCRESGFCSLDACQQRGAALDASGRLGCRNPELLDRPAPHAVHGRVVVEPA
jgi:hypothetical protein